MKGAAPTERGKRKRVKHKGVCAASGKRIYRTRKKALKAPTPIGQRWCAYRCSYCGFWHGSTNPTRPNSENAPDSAP